MIDYEGYRDYLEKIGMAENSLGTYPSYISQNKLDILNKMERYRILSDNQKLIKFSNESIEFKDEFNMHHNFTSSDTFSDLRSGARRYKYYLQYLEIIKTMEQYRIDETLLDTNGAYTYFTVFGNSYPVKAICRDNIQILELDDDFRTNDGKLKLKKIFNTQNKNNLLFFDNRENTVRNPVKINLREQVLNNNPLEIKNIILYGSPGVGKTHNTNKLISLIENNQDEKEIFASIKENKKETIILDDKLKSRVKFITFHQSFGYEDFIEGFRPNEDGNITLVPGIFKEICNKARKDLNNKYYLVIDEINRGNISKIFGELITLIEEDKRDNFEVTLPYSKEPFKIPSNLFIIGTMNSTDKSIALIDIALRRRFTFLKMKPNEDLITHPKSKAIFKSLNLQIIEDLGQDYQLGHSYFMKINSNEDLWFVLEYKIKPLLEEYYYGDNDRLKVIDDIISNI